MQDGSSANTPGSVIGPGNSTQAPAEAAPQPEPVAVAPAAIPEIPPPSPATEPGAITWDASEYIAHQKNMSWYLVLGVSAVILTALVYILSHDKLSAAIVIIVAIMFGAFASRQPHTLPYAIGSRGITINNKAYPYSLFKFFSVIDEGAFSSIVLMPMKRFMPSLSIYFPPEKEQQIMEVLSNYLPHEQLKLDMLDSFMRKVRF